MAYHIVADKYLNNMERPAGAAVMYLPTVINGKMIADGDYILLGSISKNSYTYIAVMDIVQKFTDNDVGLELGHPVYDNNGHVVGVNIFDTLKPKVWAPSAIKLPTTLNDSSGNPAGTILSAWDGDVSVAVKVVAPSMTFKPDGLLRLTFMYHNFGEKDGAYVQAPSLTVYK